MILMSLFLELIIAMIKFKLRHLILANLVTTTIFAKIWTRKNFHQNFFPPLNDLNCHLKKPFLRCGKLAIVSIVFFLVTLHGTFHSKIAKIKTSQIQ